MPATATASTSPKLSSAASSSGDSPQAEHSSSAVMLAPVTMPAVALAALAGLLLLCPRRPVAAGGTALPWLPPRPALGLEPGAEPPLPDLSGAPPAAGPPSALPAAWRGLVLAAPRGVPVAESARRDLLPGPGSVGGSSVDALAAW